MSINKAKAKIDRAIELSNQIEYIAKELQRNNVCNATVSKVYGIGDMISLELNDAMELLNG